METAYRIARYYLTPSHWMLLGIFWAITLVVFMVCRKLLCKRFKSFCHPVLLSAFAAYIFFTLLITLIARTPVASPRVELTPFWSWYEAIVNHRIGLYEEIVLNVLLFVPIGVCLRLLYQVRPGRALLVGLIFSAFIETTQLLTCRGLFEWDDMIHNAIGCWIGCCCVCMIRKDVR